MGIIFHLAPFLKNVLVRYFWLRSLALIFFLFDIFPYREFSLLFFVVSLVGFHFLFFLFGFFGLRISPPPRYNSTRTDLLYRARLNIFFCFGRKIESLNFQSNFENGRSSFNCKISYRCDQRFDLFAQKIGSIL